MRGSCSAGPSYVVDSGRGISTTLLPPRYVRSRDSSNAISLCSVAAAAVSLRGLRKVEPGNLALDCLLRVRVGVCRVAEAGRLQNLVDECGAALRVVEPGFGKAIAVVMSVMQCTA